MNYFGVHGNTNIFQCLIVSGLCLSLYKQ